MHGLKTITGDPKARTAEYQNNNRTSDSHTIHNRIPVGKLTLVIVLIFYAVCALVSPVPVLRLWLRELFHLVMHSCFSALAVL